MSNHTYTKKIGGDSIDLFFVFQVEQETVMTMVFDALGDLEETLRAFEQDVSPLVPWVKFV